MELEQISADGVGIGMLCCSVPIELVNVPEAASGDRCHVHERINQPLGDGRRDG